MITTATTKSSTANNPINELIAKVIDKYDTNKDKKLSADEFGSFLSGLLGNSVNGATSFNTATALEDDAKSTDTATRPVPFAPTAPNFSVMHGFSATNYFDEDMVSMKYTFARIAADYDPKQPGALDRVVADPRFKAAFPNAKVVGHDGIDFGGQLSDGPGRGVPVFRVDVGETFLQDRSGNAWQWMDLVNG
jgi:hypothetical protein